MKNTNLHTVSPFSDSYSDEKVFFILEHLGKEETVPKGTYLFRVESSPLPEVVLLKSGSVKAFQVTPAGEEHIYNLFRSGSTLFLLSFVTGVPPELNFVTTTQCKIVRIPHSAIQEAVVADASLSLTMLTEMGRKLTFAYKRLRECESYNSEWKICNLLLSLAERSGEEYEGKILIKEKVSQQTMASMVRISRITVARTLKVLRDTGLIETINGYICIRDEEKFVQHMHYISIPLD